MIKSKDVPTMEEIHKVVNWIAFMREKVYGIPEDQEIRVLREAISNLPKERPCFYCSNIEEHKIKYCNKFKDWKGRELINIDTPYNYCPNCGRKVEVEE